MTLHDAVVKFDTYRKFRAASRASPCNSTAFLYN